MAVNLCSEEILQKILAYLYVSVYNGLQYSRRYDGIGRRDGLKIRWWQHRVGSSPTTGTNANGDTVFENAVSPFAFFCYKQMAWVVSMT